jgi:hypothetical protein
MNIIFLRSGVTRSLVPILTLIEHKPEVIVGCILCGLDNNTNSVPSWFIDSTNEENPASQLLEHAGQGKANGYVVSDLDVFLIVKEPGSFLQLNVLAAVDCCNINYSGEGGRGGRRVLELLSKHNIRTYPSEFSCKRNSSDTWQVEAKEAFEWSFGVVASDWLPECWDLPTERY